MNFKREKNALPLLLPTISLLMCRGVHLIRDRKRWLHYEGIIIVKMESAKHVVVYWLIGGLKTDKTRNTAAQIITKEPPGLLQKQGKNKNTLHAGGKPTINVIMNTSCQPNMRLERNGDNQKSRSNRKLKNM